MPKAERRKKQEYDLGENVTVVILYPDGAKPPMLHDDDTCVVSLDREKFDAYASARGGNPYSAPRATVVPHPAGRNRDMSPEERAAALERMGVPASERPRPLSSADVFAQAGLDQSILQTLERAAEGG